MGHDLGPGRRRLDPWFWSLRKPSSGSENKGTGHGMGRGIEHGMGQRDGPWITENEAEVQCSGVRQRFA